MQNLFVFRFCIYTFLLRLFPLPKLQLLNFVIQVLPGSVPTFAFSFFLCQITSPDLKMFSAAIKTAGHFYLLQSVA